jgi:hypothetical protein
MNFEPTELFKDFLKTIAFLKFGKHHKNLKIKSL